MKKIIVITTILLLMMSSLAMAPEEINQILTEEDLEELNNLATTNEQEATRVQEEIKQRQAQLTEEQEQVIAMYREEATQQREEIKKLREQYGNDTEALRLAYQEQARQIITNYQGDMQQLANEYRARNAEELQGFIDARKELARQEVEAKKEAVKKQARERLEQENQVRIAVHSLLAMEDLTGGIGNQVSEIARAFNNRVEKITELKEEAEQTKGLRAIIAGGNQETAQQLRQEATAYKERIQELKQLREQANMSEETKALFDEQVTVMLEEQTRLEELAKKENKRGLLGWLWKNKINTDAVVVE